MTVFLRRLISGLRRLFRARHFSRDVDAELRAYLDAAIEHKVSTGMTRADAERAARIQMGSFQHTKEQALGVGWESAVLALVDDVWHACRRLMRGQSTTVTTAGVIGLSVALACASAAILDAVALRQLPVPHPEQLVLISGIDHTGRRVALTRSLYEHIVADDEQISSPFIFRSSLVEGTIGDTTRSVALFGVKGDYFATLGAVPVVGRLLGPDEREPNVVISASLWRGAFAQDPAIVGTRLRFGTVVLSIVGVTSDAFRSTDSALKWDAIVPLEQLGAITGGARPDGPVEVGARLRFGVTAGEYEAHLNTRWSSMLEATIPPGSTISMWRQRRGDRARVDSLATGLSYELKLRPSIQRAAFLTFGLSVLILATACVTLALLGVTRGATQQGQTALMLAIGGSRGRILRTYVLEGCLMALMGCAAGLLLTTWLIRVGASFLPQSANYDFALYLTPLSGGIALGMAVAATFLSGVLPAMVAFRGGVRGALGFGDRVIRPHVHLRTCLLMLQLALSVLLVHYALMFVADLRSLTQVDVGIDVDNLHVYALTGKLPRRPLDEGYFVALLKNVQTIPGVEEAGLSGGTTPLATVANFTQLVRTDAHEEVPAITACALPGFFQLLHVPFVSGVDFAWGTQGTAVITASLARILFPHANAVGETIQVPIVAEPKPRVLRVVGVVRDMAFNGPRLGPRAGVFMPCLTQTNPWPSTFVVNILVRSTRTLEELRPAIDAEVSRLGAQYVYSVRDTAGDLDASLLQERMLAQVGSTLGFLAMLVTGVALFAFCSYLQTFRSREFAVRAALGAGPMRITVSLLREVVVILCLGSALGVASTLGAQRLLASAIAGVPSLQVRDLAVGVAMVAAVVVAATVLPTWRTLRLDLARALRVE